MTNSKRVCAIVSKRAALIAILFAVFGIAAAASARAQTWIATWAASPQASAMPATFSNQTVRQIVHVSIGGSKVRVRLSNEHGTQPVVIGAASIGLAGTGADTPTNTLRPLTFGGSKSITILAGAPVVSDPVELNVPPLSNLAVSIYLPIATDIETVHQPALQTGDTTVGDFTDSPGFPTGGTFNNRVFLAGVIIETDGRARAIVAFGASHVNGNGSTLNANSRWPDILAHRVKEAGLPLAVVNAGIAGNRLLSDGIGVSGLARFERDVLSQPGVSHVIVLLGSNDLGVPGTRAEPSGIVPTPEDMVAGYKQLIERAHLRAIKVMVPR
jgi:lysophospholipase L1-like esterase